MLELAQPVFNVPFFIAQASPTRTTRVLGWGSTQPDGGGAYPVILQQDDTKVLPNSSCAGAGITEGELCIDGTGGSGVCVGDGGGPALQQFAPGPGWPSGSPVEASVRPAVTRRSSRSTPPTTDRGFSAWC